MNREKSDTILTYASSDAVLHSCAFEFCSCLHFNSFPSYCCCIIALSFSPSLPLYSLTSSWFWGKLAALLHPVLGPKMCAAVTNQLRCKKCQLSAAEQADTSGSPPAAGRWLQSINKPCPWWRTEPTPHQHKPWQKAPECTDVFMSNTIPLKSCPLLVSPGALGRRGREWC